MENAGSQIVVSMQIEKECIFKKIFQRGILRAAQRPRAFYNLCIFGGEKYQKISMIVRQGTFFL